MIRIEASNINYGGSFNLLKDLLNYCETEGYITEVYIKYEAIYNELLHHQYRNIKLKRTSNFQTIFRYCRNTSSTLFFCSLPPFVKTYKSYVYFHSEYFATSPFSNIKVLNFTGKLKKIFYYYWIKFNKNNVDNFICQTDHIKLLLTNTYSLQPLVKPFFHLEKGRDDTIKKFDFIYPAINSINKNMNLFLSALLNLRKIREFTCVLTIAEDDISVIKNINKINDIYPKTIINVGHLTHTQVFEYLSYSRCLVFPSLVESFGLPLIEALSLRLKVISSDLPYTYNCVNEPITFDPYDVDDITSKMLNFLNGDYDAVHQSSLVFDCKSEIVSLLL